MTINEIKELALHAARGTAPATFSVENVNAALLDAMRELGGSVNQFMKNRFDIYEIIIQTADEIVPKNVIGIMNTFAEVQVVGEGQKVMFKRGVLGKNRAKKFLTQVGISGVYETFRLDTDVFDIKTKAIGGAAYVDFQRILDGAENMSDLMEVITEGLTDAVFGEVQKALKAAATASGRPSANVVVHNTFDSDKMFKLCSVAKAYGNGSATIFAPPEFVAEMGADAIVPVGSDGSKGVYHPDDIDAIHRTGYVNMFRGTPIVQIPQSYLDSDNVDTQIDPQMAYVLPSGRDKVVKVVLEGPTQIHDFQNRDNSMEIHCWKKVGVGVLTNYDWCIYQNTGIPQTMKNPYGV